MLTVFVLVACGEQQGDVSSSTDQEEASPSTTSSSSDSPSSGVNPGDYEVVDIIAATAAGGRLAPRLVPVDSNKALKVFLQPFRSNILTTEVKEAVKKHQSEAGYTLHATVVAIGCEVPKKVKVSASGAARAVYPPKPPGPIVQCFAPMTTVALIDIAES
jgi:hypothetical protein